MVEIVNCYKQQVPALRFIGKKYGDEHRVNGNFGHLWGEWFKNNWFKLIEDKTTLPEKEAYEESDAYLGMMYYSEEKSFEYWIGMFTAKDSPVPEGFESIDFPENILGVCWVYGQEYEVYCMEQKCAERLISEGYSIPMDKDGGCWFFERYACPRFTQADEKGNIILDICHYISD